MIASILATTLWQPKISQISISQCLSQSEGEKIADFIGQLERTFRLAYGRGGISPETRDALLYMQLQEELKLSLMESPSVLGSTNY